MQVKNNIIAQFIKPNYYLMSLMRTLHIALQRNCELHIVSYHNCNYFIFIDVNECSLDTNSCDSNADCNNTVGSYSCQCRSGYAGNGKSCLGMHLYKF